MCLLCNTHVLGNCALFNVWEESNPDMYLEWRNERPMQPGVLLEPIVNAMVTLAMLPGA